MTEKIIDIPLKDIEDIGNVRTFADSDLLDLVTSIKKNGLIEPIVVRKSKENGHYERIVGARRIAAFRILEQPTIRAVVRVIKDEDIKQIQFEENYNREDMNLIDQAKFIKDLITKDKKKIADVSAEYNLDLTHLRNLQKILKMDESLHPHIASGMIKYSHAIILMNYPHYLQREILKAKFDEEFGFQMTIDSFKKFCKNFGIDLSQAFFDLEDKKIDKMGACIVCKFNSHHKTQGELFVHNFDEDDEMEDGNCTNGDCFNKRQHAVLDPVIQEARDSDKYLSLYYINKWKFEREHESDDEAVINVDWDAHIAKIIEDGFIPTTSDDYEFEELIEYGFQEYLEIKKDPNFFIGLIEKSIDPDEMGTIMVCEKLEEKSENPQSQKASKETKEPTFNLPPTLSSEMDRKRDKRWLKEDNKDGRLAKIQAMQAIWNKRSKYPVTGITVDHLKEIIEVNYQFNIHFDNTYFEMNILGEDEDFHDKFKKPADILMMMRLMTIYNLANFFYGTHTITKSTDFVKAVATYKVDAVAIFKKIQEERKDKRKDEKDEIKLQVKKELAFKKEMIGLHNGMRNDDKLVIVTQWLNKQGGFTEDIREIKLIARTLKVSLAGITPSEIHVEEHNRISEKVNLIRHWVEEDTKAKEAKAKKK